MRRYTDRAFPPYRHEPGNTPHPERSPDGYRHGLEAKPRVLAASEWHDNEDYLYGFDLFHAGYFWEAHAVWEELWMATRDESTRTLLQALIQTAAARLKLSLGEAKGASKLFRAALGRLESLRESTDADHLAGVDLAALRASLEAAEGKVASGPESATIRIALSE